MTDPDLPHDSGDSLDPVTAMDDEIVEQDDPTRDDSALVGNPGVDPEVPGSYPNAETAVDDDDDDVPPTPDEATFQAAQVAVGIWPLGKPPSTNTVYRSPFYNDPTLWAGESSVPHWN